MKPLSTELKAGLDDLANKLRSGSGTAVPIPPKLVKSIDQSFSKSISQSLDAVSTRERSAALSALTLTVR